MGKVEVEGEDVVEGEGEAEDAAPTSGEGVEEEEKEPCRLRDVPPPPPKSKLRRNWVREDGVLRVTGNRSLPSPAPPLLLLPPASSSSLLHPNSHHPEGMGERVRVFVRVRERVMLGVRELEAIGMVDDGVGVKLGVGVWD